jgi:hypothetical protein
MTITKITEAKGLSAQWDILCQDYYQKRSFLSYCEKYNPCDQEYFCLFDNKELLAGCIVYKLKVNLLTFTKTKSIDINMTIIGLPVAISSSGIIGKKEHKSRLIDSILSDYSGMVFIYNGGDLQIRKAFRMRGMPTIILNNPFKDTQEYINQMRKSYRRRFNKTINQDIKYEIEPFTEEHYKYYIEIMNRADSKLETLSYDFFANLPSDFVITTAKVGDEIVAWNVTLQDRDRFFFFFGGLNYVLNQLHNAYFNNLYQIIFEGINRGCKVIDLGSTAEIPKLRSGGVPIKKYFYARHSNRILHFFMKIFKKFLQYNRKLPCFEVFKS